MISPHAVIGEAKSLSTIKKLGIDIDTYRRWVEYQFTPEMNWKNIEIDLVRPISSFNVTNDEEFKEAFNWIKTRPFLN